MSGIIGMERLIDKVMNTSRWLREMSGLAEWGSEML